MKPISYTRRLLFSTDWRMDPGPQQSGGVFRDIYHVVIFDTKTL